MIIEVTKDGAAVVLAIEGRIDTKTSPELQSEILKAFQTSKAVILDFAAVPYISSAGLRTLLIGQKSAASKGVSMELINVSPTVYSILDSVGFARILTIKQN